MKVTKTRKSDPPKQTKGRVALYRTPPPEAPAPGIVSTLSITRTPVNNGKGAFNDEGNRDGTDYRGESH